MERPHSRLVRTHEVTKTEKRGCQRNKVAVMAVIDKCDAKELRGDGKGKEVDGDDGKRESDDDGERESDDDSESEEKSKRMMAMTNEMRRQRSE